MTEAVRIGARLRELREQAGLTREELATRCGLSARAIVQWERDEREPGWSNVVALGKALGVECTAFLVEPTTTEVKGPGRPRKAVAPAAEPVVELATEAVEPVKGKGGKAGGRKRAKG